VFHFPMFYPITVGQFWAGDLAPRFRFKNAIGNTCSQHYM